MSPAEIREAVARLVEAGAKAMDAQFCIDDYVGAPGDSPGQIHIYEALEDDPPLFTSDCIDEESARALALFFVTAANARPALSALAGCCVLDVETVQVLAAMGRNLQSRTGETFSDEDAALAAAEAEVARVEGR